MSGRPVFERPAGEGWLALLGGGEITFGETLDADRAWLAHTPEGPVGFVPAASGSVDYGTQLASYLGETFGREVETLPVYRARDARRGKHGERLAALAAVYLGGGLGEQLVEALAGTPFHEALAARLRAGGTVVAIAAAAQALGVRLRGLRGDHVAGLGWLRGGAVETNFDPEHDRRLRQLLDEPGVRWAVGLPAGSALLLGPEGTIEVVGEAWVLRDPEGEPEVLAQEDLEHHEM